MQKGMGSILNYMKNFNRHKWRFTSLDRTGTCCVFFLCAIFSNLNAQDRQLVWAEEFDGAAIDRSVWEFGSGPTNDNVHFYTDRTDNAAIVDGKLQIKALKEPYQGFEYTSALLHTKHSLNWRYGRVEARIRLPGSPGFVPAFWMLPAGERFGWWPLSGEIDVMEYPTNEVSKIYGTIHTEIYNLFTGPSPPRGGVTDIPDAASAFHIYAAEWNETQIDFYVDDQKYYTYVNDNGGSGTWPFDEPFHIILNLAVGGGWVGNPTGASVFPAVMEVDYVRLYQEAGDLIINGPDDVPYNSEGATYRIPEPDGAAYQWRVPGGAQIVSGQGTGRIAVDWGIFGGGGEVEITTGQGSFVRKLPVRVSPNLLRNAGFETGVKYWNKREGFPEPADFRLVPGEAPQGEHALQVTVSEPAANAWDIQLSQQGFQLEKGKSYRVSLKAKSMDAAVPFNAALIHAADYSLLHAESIAPGVDWAGHTFAFTAPGTVPAAFNLDLGAQPGTCLFDELVITTAEMTSLNQLRNPDFFDEGEAWNFITYAPAEASGSVSDGVYTVDITSGGVYAWDIHLGQGGIAVETGKEYTVSFDAWAAATRDISAIVGKNEDPWTVYSGDQIISLSTDRQTHTFTFVMNEPADSAARLGFDLGGDPIDVYVDNVVIGQGEVVIGLPRMKAASAVPFSLLENHPNPVRSATTIHYNLHRPARVQLQILDLHGREIGTLVDEFQMEGAYSASWEPGGLAGGIYFYQLRSSGFAETRKLIVVH